MIEIKEIGEHTVITLITILILLLLSAFFSGSETALPAASKARLHQLSLQGQGRARTVLRLRRNNETLIGAILIGFLFNC